MPSTTPARRLAPVARTGLALAQVALALGAEAVAVYVLHRLGSVHGLAAPLDSVSTWFRTSPPGDVLAGAIRLVALGLAWWLLLVTVLGALARALGFARARRRLDRASPALVRRLLDRGLALSLATGVGCVVAPVTASASERPAAHGAPRSTVTPEPSLPPVVRDGRALLSIPSPRTPDASTTRAPITEPATPPLDVQVQPGTVVDAVGTPTAVAPTAHVVARGEHLWRIAAEHLARQWARDPRSLHASEIAPYWQQVCDANRATLASGDVNLIYAGETILLPPLQP